MASSRSSLRESGPTAGSLPVFNLYSSAINRDSKAQHVLGLSRTELSNARNQPLNTKSSPKTPPTSKSNRFYTRNPFSRSRGSRAEVNNFEVELNLTPSVTSDDLDRQSDVTSASEYTSLRKCPSNSTVRSSCDVATAPLNPSYQSSNFSSQVCASPPVDSAICVPARSEMEYYRQPHFSKPSRLRSISENKYFDKHILREGSEASLSPVSRGSTLSTSSIDSPYITQVSVLPRSSTPKSPLPIYQPDAYSGLGYEKIDPVNIERNPISYVDHPAFKTPYAKVHVRRPKAGTKHWFDDLEGMSSEEEENQEPDFKQQFVIEVERVYENGRVKTRSAIKDFTQKARDQKTIRPQVHEISELAAEPVLPSPKPTGNLKAIANSKPIGNPKPMGTFKSTGTPKPSGNPTSLRQSSRKASNFSKSRSNPLAQADLNQESVLYLSVSEDEHEDEAILRPVHPIQQTEPIIPLRKSVSSDNYEDSDIEIGLAHTIQATGRIIGTRSSPIRVVQSDKSSPSTPPSSATSGIQATPEAKPIHSGSFFKDDSDMKDTEEDALISSFPDTPTEANRPRSSVSLSDSQSVASMKLMKVTRQEENLISAIRMKKAAMRKVAERKKGPKPKETIESIVVPARRSSLAGQTPLPTRESLTKPSPPPLKVSGFVPSEDGVSPEISRPGTAPLPDIHDKRSPISPLASSGMEDNPSQSSSLIHRRYRSLSKSRASPSRHSFGLFPRPQSYLSRTSLDSQKRESTIIVLDNLNSALPNPSLPAQLFMESPFSGWDRNDSAVVH